MTTTRPDNNQVTWRPSSFRDETSPSTVFRVVTGLLVFSWIILTGWVVTATTTVGSPDEAANQFFIHHLAVTGQYRANSGLAAEVNQVLYPRSSARYGQFLAPGSFLGLVQTGAVAVKLFGVGAERMITPLLALGGLLAMYFFLRRFWERSWALMATVLVAVHPAWLGLMTLPYLHNGAFVAVLLMSGWALLRLLEQPTFWRAVLTGVLFGGALYFRPVEVVWTVPLIIILLAARRLWWQLGIVGFLTLALQLPWLLVNRELYGSWLSSAYTPSGVFSDDIGTSAAIAPAKVLFTPPGGAWTWHWLSSTWWYLIVLASPVSALTLIALGQYVRRTVRGVKALKLGLVGAAFIFFLVYYGTWDLYPTNTASEIGWLASYVRYWLPLYVAFSVGAVVGLRQIFPDRIAMVMVMVLIASQAIISVGHPNSGLVHRFAADRTGQARQQFILNHTETDSLVIAGQQDKYLFGRRRVAFAWPTNAPGLQALATTVVVRPVYLYGTLNQFSEESLRNMLTPVGLTLGQGKKLGSETLWPILRP